MAVYVDSRSFHNDATKVAQGGGVIFLNVFLEQFLQYMDASKERE